MPHTILKRFQAKLTDGRGKPGGYPGDFEYSINFEKKSGTITLILDSEMPKRTRGKSFWRRPDTWGLSILHELMQTFQDSNRPRTFALEVRVAMPGEVNERSKFEALRRRLSYLAEVNKGVTTAFNAVLGIDIHLFSNGNVVDFDQIIPNAPAEHEIVIRNDYNSRDDKDVPGRLEKDLQAFLFGKGLYQDEGANIVPDLPPLTAIDSSMPHFSRCGSRRLALLGEDFFFGAKLDKVKLMREFPTGAFKEGKSRYNRLLPTWYIDFLTVNKHGELAAIETKFIEKGAAALEDVAQLLDYSLYFHYYRKELAEQLKKMGVNWKEDRKKICGYLVSNVFHERLNHLWRFYNQKPDLIHLKRIGMGCLV